MGTTTCPGLTVLWSCQPAEVDYAWNLQVEWGVLQSMASRSNPGDVNIARGTGAERILVSMTDPNTTVDGQKSHLGTPHPFQSLLPVRQAYAMAIQRDVLTQQLYGETGTVTPNILCGPTAFV